jgi:V-type H+-transporting ATPase subunit a
MRMRPPPPCTLQVSKVDLTAASLRPMPVRAPRGGEGPLTMDELEAKLDQLEKETAEANSNEERLQRSYAELAELQVLLEKGGQFFGAAQRTASTRSQPTPAEEDRDTPLLAAAVRDPKAAPPAAAVPAAALFGGRRGAGGSTAEQEAGVCLYVKGWRELPVPAPPQTLIPRNPAQTDPTTARQSTGPLGFVAGLIQQGKMAAFERLLFRVTRGNMFLKSTSVGSVRDPATGDMQDKSVFMVFFSGERARTKVMKVRGGGGIGELCVSTALKLLLISPSFAKKTHTHTRTRTHARADL